MPANKTPPQKPTAQKGVARNGPSQSSALGYGLWSSREAGSAPWFKWLTLGGDEHEGKVIDVDSNVLIVRCTDGKTRAVEC